MSAYQCTREHIAQLAALLTVPWQPGADPMLDDRVGAGWRREGEHAYEYVFRRLWEENAASVAYRYSEAPTPAPTAPPCMSRDVVRSLRTAPTFAAQVVKAVQCYTYQACETPAWNAPVGYGPDAKQWCEALVNRALERIQGYDAAPWGAPFPV